MKDNAIRESVHNKEIHILHCPGKNNVGDIFTKEDKDKEHFIQMRDTLVTDPF